MWPEVRREVMESRSRCSSAIVVVAGELRPGWPQTDTPVMSRVPKYPRGSRVVTPGYFSPYASSDSDTCPDNALVCCHCGKPILLASV